MEYFKIPTVCPYCGAKTIIKKDNESEFLYCTNNACLGQLINRLNHFCSKKGLDIKGLSKTTLEKLINWEWVTNIKDLFQLNNYKKDWIEKPGFGEISVNKILKAIEESKKCSSSKYICALGIPLIGKVASEALIKTFGSYNNFRLAIDNKDDKLYEIAGIGEVMIETMLNYDYTEADEIFNNYIKEDNATVFSSNDTELKDKIFCITGKIKNWKNRNELKSFIESKGGKVTGSVTSKTSYLINNDTDSETTKNKTAKKLNIPIISEEDFISMIKI